MKVSVQDIRHMEVFPVFANSEDGRIIGWRGQIRLSSGSFALSDMHLTPQDALTDILNSITRDYLEEVR